MTNKRWLILGTGVLVMVLFTAGYAVSGIKGHFDRGHSKEFVQEKVLSHMDYTMQELQLTPAQQAKYSTIRAKMGASLNASFKKYETMHDSMKAQWDEPNPDIKAITQRMKHNIQSIPEQINIKIDYMLEVYDILDDAQQKQLVQMIRKHINDKKDCS